MMLKLILNLGNRIEEVGGDSHTHVRDERTEPGGLSIAYECGTRKCVWGACVLGSNLDLLDQEAWCGPPLRPVEGSAPLSLFGSPYFFEGKESPLPAVVKKSCCHSGFHIFNSFPSCQ